MNAINILKIIRVHIVAGGFLAYLLGVLLATVEGGGFEPIPVALGYTVVLLGDLSTHYSNDYFDVETDRQMKTKKVFSGKKILVTNSQLRPLAKTTSLTLLLASDIIAAMAVLFLDFPAELFIIAFAANTLGWAYSAPPIRLSSKGLGEIAIAVATGFVIPAIGYLSVRGGLDSLFLYFSIPFMIYGFLLSINLEAPDIENDQKGEKRTLAVRAGERHIFFTVLAAALLASLTFFSLTLQLASNVIDLTVVFLFSFIPLTAGILGFAISFKKRELDKFSALNISSLFLFITAMDMYLASLILW